MGSIMIIRNDVEGLDGIHCILDAKYARDHTDIAIALFLHLSCTWGSDAHNEGQELQDATYKTLWIFDVSSVWERWFCRAALMEILLLWSRELSTQEILLTLILSWVAHRKLIL
jgi:hypothetical protein